MGQSHRQPLIRTIKERCKVCYTCVRECPAKAIRISGGQAEVIEDRCIGCGICVRVCSQNAKVVRTSLNKVEDILNSDSGKIACIAPSFPAEFIDIQPEKLVGVLKSLGFDKVVEVAFGADLVAKKYAEMVDDEGKGSMRHIATTCPAIVSYIEKYHPSLVRNLANLVSPMIATARVISQFYGSNYKKVFIGPCLAKKDEAMRDELYGEINAVITFSELRDLMKLKNIDLTKVEDSNFDLPYPGKGMLFAIEKGMLEAAELKEDLMTNEIVATDGAKNFVQAIKEFEKGALNAKLLEVLCCNGCIMGSGMTNAKSHFARRTAVGKYAKERTDKVDVEAWKKQIEEFEYLNFGREFKIDDHRLPAPSKDELKRIFRAMGKYKPQDELNCGACGYDTCIDHAIAIHKGLAENEMCLPFTIDTLKETAKELSFSYEQLVSAKNALAQAEKLAGMGQLAAGIAHEVNNPLGVVLLYANLLYEECPEDNPIREDLKMIVDQGERAKKIVSGLLNFARKNKLNIQSTDISKLIDKSLKGIIKPKNISLVIDHKVEDIIADIDSDQMMQVVLNLITNSIEAMPDGGIINIITDKYKDMLRIIIRDNGTGIEEKKIKKVFEPFYTTKQIGKGTGLGLAVSYGIVKMHSGNITVSSNNNPDKGETFTEFIVSVPRNNDKINNRIK